MKSDGRRWWLQTDHGLVHSDGAFELATNGGVFWRDDALRSFWTTGEAWYVAANSQWAKLDDHSAAWDAAPRITSLTAAPPGALNALLEAPDSFDDLLCAMTEISARGQADQHTVRFLLRRASTGIAASSPDEQRVAARAWFTLGALARFGAAEVPADRFPWLDDLLRVAVERRWAPLVRVGAVQAIGLIWRPPVERLHHTLVAVARDADQAVAQMARTVLGRVVVDA